MPHVLWAYRTIPRSVARETPFKMVYDTEVIILVEIRDPTFRIANLNLNQYEGNIKIKLDLIE